MCRVYNKEPSSEAAWVDIGHAPLSMLLGAVHASSSAAQRVAMASINEHYEKHRQSSKPYTVCQDTRQVLLSLSTSQTRPKDEQGSVNTAKGVLEGFRRHLMAIYRYSYANPVTGKKQHMMSCRACLLYAIGLVPDDLYDDDDGCPVPTTQRTITSSRGCLWAVGQLRGERKAAIDAMLRNICVGKHRILDLWREGAEAASDQDSVWRQICEIIVKGERRDGG